MSKSLYEIITRLFDIPDDFQLTADMGAGDVRGWDSIGWISLLSEVEEYYGIIISLDEAAELKNIGDFKKLIERKTS